MNNRLRFRTRIALFLLSLVLLPDWVQAFCGFYVAKADASLFNKSSQVIMVRDGNETTLTMFNDYQGPVKDFAMVVPVPVVLKREQIKTIAKTLFTAFDDYSAPRLVEYHDTDPCILNTYREFNYQGTLGTAGVGFNQNMYLADATTSSVKVEAQYFIDGYDIVILSAEESGGLETWLTQNGYKIPPGAKEVLEPYIRNNMKFFVVKVNLGESEIKESADLKPLQISFESPKFMLPIRLGMANASGDQDLIIYTLTRKGRVEPVNYRMSKMLTDYKIPEFLQKSFGKFYSAVYNKCWQREGGTSLLLEYAWDISGVQAQKCDPCPSPPLTYPDLQAAGVNWLTENEWGGYEGDLYFTRMHVRYNRANYPQDLSFMETPNRENYQARYVMTHPALSRFECEESGKYIREVIFRRQQELNNLAYLTGWDVSRYSSYVDEWKAKYENVTGYEFTTSNLLFPSQSEENTSFQPFQLANVSSDQPLALPPLAEASAGGQSEGAKWFFIFGLALTCISVVMFSRKTQQGEETKK